MEIIHQLITFADAHGLSTVVALVAAQFALGVAVAIKDGKFHLSEIGNIFQKAGPLVIGYLTVDLLIQRPDLTAAVLGVIVAQATADIAAKLTEIYPSLGAILPKSIAPKV